MKIYSLTFLIFGFATSLLSAQNLVLIDDFTDAIVPLTQVGVGTETQTTLNLGTLGGERVDSVTVTNVPSPFVGTIANNSGELVISQGADDQILGSVVYSGFSDLDLTAGGRDSFFLDFVSTDAIPLNNVLSISVTSGGNSAESFVAVPTSSNLGLLPVVSFADFSGVDLTSVDAISLIFDFASAQGADFSLGSFEAGTAVPEPSSSGLCFLLVGGMFLRRRRNG